MNIDEIEVLRKCGGGKRICEKCKYNIGPDEVECRIAAMRDAANEINHLKAEIFGQADLIESLQAQLVGKAKLMKVNKSLLDAAISEYRELRHGLSASQAREKATVNDIKYAATTSEKVCKWCLYRGNYEHCQLCRWSGCGGEAKLREWSSGTPKNEPLTRKNLRSMNDQSVWVQYPEIGMAALVAYHSDNDDGDEVYLTNNLGGRSTFAEVLEQGGTVYRHKPAETEGTE